MKVTWNLINTLLNKEKPRHHPSYVINDDGLRIEGNTEIADAFNTYFVSIGTKLANKLPLSTSVCESFLGARCSQSLFLSPVTEEEIVAYLGKISCKKSSWRRWG